MFNPPPTSLGINQLNTIDAPYHTNIIEIKMDEPTCQWQLGFFCQDYGLEAWKD